MILLDKTCKNEHSHFENQRIRVNFRKIIVDGNLCVLKNSNILLFQKDDLPLSKITNICNKMTANSNLAQMKNTTFFKEFLEASNFIRFSKTQNEGSDLEALNIDSDDGANIQHIKEEEESRGQVKKRKNMKEKTCFNHFHKVGQRIIYLSKT